MSEVKKKQFEQACLEQAIEALFSHNFFSICGVDKIGKMIGVQPEKHPTYKFLSALHCVHYSDMRPEIRAQLQQKVIEVLRPDGQLSAEVIARAITIESGNYTNSEDTYLDHQASVVRLPHTGKR